MLTRSLSYIGDDAIRTLENYNADAIILRPFKRNVRAIKCYEKCNFKNIYEYIGEDTLVLCDKCGLSTNIEICECVDNMEVSTEEEKEKLIKK